MHSVAIGERGASVDEEVKAADADANGADRDAAVYSSASRCANDENAVSASEARRRALSGSPQSGMQTVERANRNMGSEPDNGRGQ